MLLEAFLHVRTVANQYAMDQLYSQAGAVGRGWEPVEMVRKYAHLPTAHLVGYVDRLSRKKLVGDVEFTTISLRLC